MDISRIGQGTTSVTDVLRPGKSTAGDKNPFLGALKDAVAEIDRTQSEADVKVRSMLNGDGEDLHATMLAVEKASLSFELMMQVRNKVVNAYQEIARLQF